MTTAELFLLCALALPDVFSSPPIEKTKVYYSFIQAVSQRRPGHKIYLLKDLELPLEKYERLPFGIMGYTVYVKRCA